MTPVLEKQKTRRSEVTRLLPSEWTDWDRFVREHKLGSIYHTSNWCKVIERAFHHTPCYLVLKGSSGEIEAGMPLFLVQSPLTGRRLVSLPAAQACNPLVSRQKDYDRLMAFARDLIQTTDASHLEINTTEDFPYQMKQDSATVNDYFTFVLDLADDLEQIEKRFHSSCVRRAIRRSRKNGLQLVVAHSEEDVKTFYRLYLDMRRQKGLLPMPYIFFKAIWESFSEKGWVEILHAEYEGEIISSVFLLKYKDTMTYEYGASLVDSRKLSPSPFLLWEAIKRAKREGFPRFDFGRTSLENESLATFKSRWGARRVQLPYYFIPELRGGGAIRGQGLSKKVMNWTVSICPGSVCRLLGRALYRHLV